MACNQHSHLRGGSNGNKVVTPEKKTSSSQRKDVSSEARSTSTLDTSNTSSVAWRNHWEDSLVGEFSEELSESQLPPTLQLSKPGKQLESHNWINDKRLTSLLSEKSKTLSIRVPSCFVQCLQKRLTDIARTLSVHYKLETIHSPNVSNIAIIRGVMVNEEITVNPSKSDQDSRESIVARRTRETKHSTVSGINPTEYADCLSQMAKIDPDHFISESFQVPSRTSPGNGTKKTEYNVSTQEIVRRMSPPELMSNNAILRIIRKDKKTLERLEIIRDHFKLGPPQPSKCDKSDLPRYTLFSNFPEGEIMNLGFSLGKIMDKIKPCPINPEECSSIWEAIHRFKQFYVTNTNFERLTHSGGPCIISMVVESLKDYLSHAYGSDPYSRRQALKKKEMKLTSEALACSTSSSSSRSISMGIGGVKGEITEQIAQITSKSTPFTSLQETKAQYREMRENAIIRPLQANTDQVVPSPAKVPKSGISKTAALEGTIQKLKRNRLSLNRSKKPSTEYSDFNGTKTTQSSVEESNKSQAHCCNTNEVSTRNPWAGKSEHFPVVDSNHTDYSNMGSMSGYSTNCNNVKVLPITTKLNLNSETCETVTDVGCSGDSSSASVAREVKSNEMESCYKSKLKINANTEHYGNIELIRAHKHTGTLSISARTAMTDTTLHGSEDRQSPDLFDTDAVFVASSQINEDEQDKLNVSINKGDHTTSQFPTSQGFKVKNIDTNTDSPRVLGTLDSENIGSTSKKVTVNHVGKKSLSPKEDIQNSESATHTRPQTRSVSNVTTLGVLRTRSPRICKGRKNIHHGKGGQVNGNEKPSPAKRCNRKRKKTQT